LPTIPEVIQEVFKWVVPSIALSLLVLTLVPAEFWQQPAVDAIYQGFDFNLLYIDEKGYATAKGIIEISNSSLKLTALPFSNPTVHLLTTPMQRFRAEMDIRIIDAGRNAIPLRLDIWSPRSAVSYSLIFTSSNSSFGTYVIKEGSVSKTLINGKLTCTGLASSFFTGQVYHLEIDLDKSLGALSTRLSTREEPPSGGSMLMLKGGPGDPEYSDVISLPVSIKEGVEYHFGGFVKLVSGDDAYKITIGWYDKDLKFVGFSNDWRPVSELGGWTRKEFKATAPNNATFARLFLGSGKNTYLLFADLFIYEVSSPQSNLLWNGDFRKGTEGWENVTQNSISKLEIIKPSVVTWVDSVSKKDFPELFNSTRLTLTVSSFSYSGISITSLENYRLVLPHQRWVVAKIEDTKAMMVLLTLYLAGGFLIILRITRENVLVRYLQKHYCWVSSYLNLRLRHILVLACYILFNVLLFNLGGHPFDILSEKTYAYVAAKYGPSQLYFLPNLVPLAKVWGGGPWHEAAFFYHPLIAYLATVIGWVYKLFYSGSNFTLDSFALEFTIKLFNLLFAFACSILIYLILHKIGVRRGWATVAMCLFLFNPAVMFSASIWGQNHVVSVFFLLASIWLVENRHAALSWIGLLACILTRPQMLVPALILAIVFIRKFSAKENLYGISWAIITVSLVLAPFSLSISPSLPIDIFKAQWFVQEGGGNEKALTTVSLDAYNIWPLITYFTENCRGLLRIYYPSASPFIDNLSYQQTSLFIVIIVTVIIAIFVWRRELVTNTPGSYLLYLASATFSFLLFKTGLASTHFIIGIPLLILCVKQLSPVNYLLVNALFTSTTFVPLYGSFGFSILNVDSISQPLKDSYFTKFFMSLFTNDKFITIGIVLNVYVLLLLLFGLKRSLHIANIHSP
jgi:hypothetical protein